MLSGKTITFLGSVDLSLLRLCIKSNFVNTLYWTT